jgi:hypothetical protein
VVGAALADVTVDLADVTVDLGEAPRARTERWLPACADSSSTSTHRGACMHKAHARANHSRASALEV